jgi:putative endonuclease
MAFYVYIIQSKKDKSFYKGYTENYEKRLDQHNKGESSYTSKKIPWNLVYLEMHNSKKEALIREKNLKKAALERIIALIASSKNLVRK